jgi:hypothetical protein
LFFCGKSRDAKGDGYTEETIREEIDDFGQETLEDLESPLDPDLFFLKAARDGIGRKPLLFVKISKELELLSERRLSPWIVSPKTFNFCLEAAPGFDDHPGFPLSFLSEREVSFESVDQFELTPVLEDEERIVTVDGCS